jgi:hypothetical protein
VFGTRFVADTIAAALAALTPTLAPATDNAGGGSRGVASGGARGGVMDGADSGEMVALAGRLRSDCIDRSDLSDDAQGTLLREQRATEEVAV